MPVTTSERESTSIVGDSSKGIITIPKLKTVTLREFTKPTCADPSDQLVEAPGATSAPSTEVAAALAQTVKDNASADYQRRLNARVDELERALEKRARDLGSEGVTEIEKIFCPRLSGQMKANEISEIVFERREVFRKEEKGYTEVRYESSATLLPMKSKFADGDLSDAARLLRSVKADARGCVEVKMISEENGYSFDDLRKIAKELETVIHRHRNGVIYEQALKETGPAPK